MLERKNQLQETLKELENSAYQSGTTDILIKDLKLTLASLEVYCKN